MGSLYPYLYYNIIILWDHFLYTACRWPKRRYAAHEFIRNLSIKCNYTWNLLSELVWHVAWGSPDALVTKHPGVRFITEPFNIRSAICDTELAMYPMFDLYPQPQLFAPISMEGLPRVSNRPTHFQHPYYWYWSTHDTLSISLTNACFHCFERAMEIFISFR